MMVGALWCIGGIAVTAGAYSLAALSLKDGHYIGPWGSIAFGAIQFLKGLLSIGQATEGSIPAMSSAAALPGASAAPLPPYRGLPLVVSVLASRALSW